MPSPQTLTMRMFHGGVECWSNREKMSLFQLRHVLGRLSDNPTLSGSKSEKRQTSVVLGGQSASHSHYEYSSDAMGSASVAPAHLDG